MDLNGALKRFEELNNELAELGNAIRRLEETSLEVPEERELYEMNCNEVKGAVKALVQGQCDIVSVPFGFNDHHYYIDKEHSIRFTDDIDKARELSGRVEVHKVPMDIYERDDRPMSFSPCGLGTYRAAYTLPNGLRLTLVIGSVTGGLIEVQVTDMVSKVVMYEPRFESLKALIRYSDSLEVLTRKGVEARLAEILTHREEGWANAPKKEH